MDKKLKKMQEITTPNDLEKYLDLCKQQFERATRKEEFDQIKQQLITLYDPIRKNRVLEEYEDTRIDLLKACNINLQFLNRIDEVWTKMMDSQIETAYKEIIITNKILNEHPDRGFLKAFVISSVSEALERIATIATAGNQAQRTPRMELKTIAPNAPIPNSTTTVSGGTPSAFPSPFSAQFPSSPSSLPTPPATVSKPSIPPPSSNVPSSAPTTTFDTLFKPVTTTEQTFIPTPSNPPSQNAVRADNSIQTYWVKSTKKARSSDSEEKP